MKELERLVVGDEVLVFGGVLTEPRVAKITKITPTRQMVLHTGERVSRDGGIGSGWNRRLVRPATESDREAERLAHDRRALRAALEGVSRRVSDMDRAELDRLLAALGK